MEEYGAIFSNFESGKHFMLASDSLDKFKVLPDWRLTPTSTAPILLSKSEGLNKEVSTTHFSDRRTNATLVFKSLMGVNFENNGIVIGSL